MGIGGQETIGGFVTIRYYKSLLNLSSEQLAKVNQFREKAGYAPIN